MDKLAYKLSTFAELTELSIRFLKQQIYDGELKAIKKGGHWRIPAEAAKEYLSGSEKAQKTSESLATTA